MFRNMKLSAKMGLGFGVMIVLSMVLSGVGWSGISNIAEKIHLEGKAGECSRHLDMCARYRRDAVIDPDTKGADGKTAPERFRDSFAAFTSELRGLGETKGLSSSDRGLIATAQEHGTLYSGAFDKLMESGRIKAEAFASWGKVGTSITVGVQDVLEKTIKPALDRAVQSNDAAQIARWSQISNMLHEEFVERFLLLRVRGTYLIATNADQQWTDLQQQLVATREGLDKWSQLVAGEAELVEVVNGFAANLKDYATAGEHYRNGILQDRASAAQMLTIGTDLDRTFTELNKSITQAVDAQASLTTVVMLSVGLAVLLLGVVLAVVITRSIVKPINRIISGLNEGAEQVTDAAAQVASASQQLAGGASEQAASLEETSSALQEVSAMTRTNAGNAKNANELSTQASQAAAEGDRTVGELNTAMSAISESSQKIGKIIKVIEEIAFQTNLLALNAAVEAARAGEHGKGFAVVADEVRNLAQRAAQAARETTELIEDSVGRVKQGTQVAENVGKSLAAIVSDVTQVTELINGIAHASEEQAQGVDQVSTAVTQMDQVTQQNASAAEESASASEELAAQAEAVKSMVNEMVALVGGSKAAAQMAQGTTVSTRQANRPVAVQSAKAGRPTKTATAPKTAAVATRRTATPSRPPANSDLDIDMGGDDNMDEF